MPDTHATTREKCPTCGAPSAPGGGFCPDCRAQLVPPPGFQRSPRWFITLLLAIIAVLFIYACFLAWQVLVLHRY